MSTNPTFRSLCSLGLCRKRAGQLQPSAGAYSEIGLRKTNDDLVFAADQCRLYVALDGIGGHAGGSEASKIMLDKLRSSVESMCESASGQPDVDLKQAVATAMSEATKQMVELAQKAPEFDKMGTVFALGYVVDDVLLYTRVGDARVYLVREGRAKQLTTDETYVQLMVDVGVIEPEEATDHPLKNVILNAVGTRSPDSPASVYSTLLLPGDIILLTTDGVTDKLPDDALAELLTADKEPEILAQAVVQAALDAGTKDNASCVVVRIDRARDDEPVAHEELHVELSKLHDMLSKVDSLDDELRADMRQIADDIRDALQKEHDAKLPGLAKDLSDRALAFEISHPRLTNTIGTIASLLARMGI